MSQKNCRDDRGTKTMYSSVVADQGCEWDCARTEAGPRLDVSMDEPVQIEGVPVVLGPLASAPSHAWTGPRGLRASGGSGSPQTQEYRESAELLWCGSDRAGAGRSGRPSHAQRKY